MSRPLDWVVESPWRTAVAVIAIVLAGAAGSWAFIENLSQADRAEVEQVETSRCASKREIPVQVRRRLCRDLADYLLRFASDSQLRRLRRTLNQVSPKGAARPRSNRTARDGPSPRRSPASAADRVAPSPAPAEVDDDSPPGPGPSPAPAPPPSPRSPGSDGSNGGGNGSGGGGNGGGGGGNGGDQGPISGTVDRITDTLDDVTNPLLP